MNVPDLRSSEYSFGFYTLREFIRLSVGENLVLVEWMNGWMDGQMIGQVDGYVHG